MKNEKGISLISLVVTIVVLMILVGISSSTGINNAQETKDNVALTEIKLVQHAILERYIKYNLTGDESILKGKEYNNFTSLDSILAEIKERTSAQITLKDTDPNNYYLLDKESLAEIGISNTEDEYIVNYKTGEVINKTRLATTKSKEPLYIYSTEAE